MKPEHIGVIIVTFIAFLFVPTITKTLDYSLDTLPIRFLAILLVLGALSYDKLVAIGIFMLILAIYIQHHHNEVVGIIGTVNNVSAFNKSSMSGSSAIQKLDHGGVADETHDTSDFTPRHEDQDNEFKYREASIDEKHALITEPLGSRAQTLFPDDSRHVNDMEHGNKNGHSD
jgi:hypothetical protein